MSRVGAPELQVLDGGWLRVGVVAAQWHAQVMDGLLAGALSALDQCGVQEPTVVRVPGTFELPVVAKRLADLGYDAVVCLGVVVRGGTPHFDYVCRAAAEGINRVALDTGVPVGFGVLTCDNAEQALERSGLPGSKEDKGGEAALAAVATALTLRSLKHGQA